MTLIMTVPGTIALIRIISLSVLRVPVVMSVFFIRNSSALLHICSFIVFLLKSTATLRLLLLFFRII